MNALTGGTAYNELGYYALGGHVESQRDLSAECHQAEAMGL